MTADIPPAVDELIHSMITSLDGRMNDTDGNLGPGGPKELA